jgi:O-antigen/teichoic acid export membrane protein
VDTIPAAATASPAAAPVGARPVPGSAADKASAERVVSTSILISASRCLVTYILLPFVAPIIGIAGDLTPVIGILIGAVAIVANVFGIRRFWRADHKWKVPYTVLAVGIILAMVVLMVEDLADILA